MNNIKNKFFKLTIKLIGNKGLAKNRLGNSVKDFLTRNCKTNEMSVNGYKMLLHDNMEISLRPYEPIETEIVKSHTVLIVEDNNVNMLLTKTLIKKINTNTRLFEAKDGLEAVALFEKESIDLILMDVQMPNMNGYEATKAIRALEKGKETPIIAITAGILAHERERCFEAGMDDYLSKPIIKDDLETILHKWLV